MTRNKYCIHKCDGEKIMQYAAKDADILGLNSILLDLPNL